MGQLGLCLTALALCPPRSDGKVTTSITSSIASAATVRATSVSYPRRKPLSKMQIGDIRYSVGSGEIEGLSEVRALRFPGGSVQCGICNKTLRSMYAFNNHVKIVHVKGKYTCKLCGNRTFMRKSNLVAHERLHRGIRPHRCKYCNITFGHKQNMISHERRHTGELPFNCTFCSRRFRQMGTLIAHHRVHTKEKPFRCEMCGKVFTETTNLRLHKLIHTGEMPYECTVCKKRFNRNHNLRRHMEIHKPVRSLKCEHCGHRFTQKTYLQRHLREAHNKTHRYVRSVALMVSTKNNTTNLLHSSHTAKEAATVGRHTLPQTSHGSSRRLMVDNSSSLVTMKVVQDQKIQNCIVGT